MGHDISGYNKEGNEVAYARFSMGNRNATIIYRLLDAFQHYGGVSGKGRSSTFSIQQIEKALRDCNQLFSNKATSHSSNDPIPWDQKQIQDFIINCLETAQKEGSVKVFFG